MAQDRKTNRTSPRATARRYDRTGTAQDRMPMKRARLLALAFGTATTAAAMAAIGTHGSTSDALAVIAALLVFVGTLIVYTTVRAAS